MKPKTELFCRKLPGRVGYTVLGTVLAVFFVVYPVADIARNGFEGADTLTRYCGVFWIFFLAVGLLIGVGLLGEKVCDWKTANAARIEVLDEKVSEKEGGLR